MKLSNFDIAVDSSGMKQRLQSIIERLYGAAARIETLHVSRVFPRKDGGFSIGYELNIDADKTKERMILWGHLLGPVQSLPGNSLEPRHDLVIFDDIGLALPVFPSDPKLKYLPEYFGKNEIVKRRLKDISFLTSLDFEIVGCQLLGYRLERRCAIKYVLDMVKNGRRQRLEIAAKILPPKKTRNATDILKKLADNDFTGNSADGLTAPDLLGYDDKRGIIIMEFAPGESLHAIAEEKRFIDSCREAGRILKKLHSTSLEGLPSYRQDDELDSLREKIDIAVNTFPETGRMFADAFAAVAGEKIVDDHPVVPVHRDFYDKQTLHLPGRTTLLDFDNLVLSDPAVDYGNFMAHLTLRRAQRPERGAVILRGAKSFASGYGIFDTDFEKRAAWWKKTALLRLAFLYYLRPRWKTIALSLLSDNEYSTEGKNILTGEKK